MTRYISGESRERNSPFCARSGMERLWEKRLRPPFARAGFQQRSAPRWCSSGSKIGRRSAGSVHTDLRPVLLAFTMSEPRSTVGRSFRSFQGKFFILSSRATIQTFFERCEFYCSYESTCSSPKTALSALFWRRRLPALAVSLGRTPVLGLATHSKRLGQTS